MEERVANVEGAIKLLTDMLAKQDEKIDRQDKMLARLEANQIVFNAKTSILEQTLNRFIERTENLFIQAGRELRDHEDRIHK